MRRIDLLAFISAEHLLADVVNPEDRDGQGQQEMIEAFRISQLGRF